jgi:hypothetical protein
MAHFHEEKSTFAESENVFILQSKCAIHLKGLVAAKEAKLR